MTCNNFSSNYSNIRSYLLFIYSILWGWLQRRSGCNGHLFIVADDDEFDSYDTLDSAQALCKARAIYDYAAVQYDELTIKPGGD